MFIFSSFMKRICFYVKYLLINILYLGFVIKSMFPLVDLTALLLKIILEYWQLFMFRWM